LIGPQGESNDKKHIIMPNDKNAEPIVIDADDFSEVKLPEGENIDWKAEAEKFKGMAERRGTKLSKFKQQQAPAPKNDPTPAAQDPKKGELDFAQMAYLNSLGFADPEDHKFIQNAMKETGRDLLTTMQSPYITGELQKLKEERATKAAQPPADGRDGQGAARDSVEYWLNAGKMPPADQPKLRQAVVNAKIAREKSGGSVFSKNPIIK
jgi:hypothetical protein